MTYTDNHLSIRSCWWYSMIYSDKTHKILWIAHQFIIISSDHKLSTDDFEWQLNFQESMGFFFITYAGCPATSSQSPLTFPWLFPKFNFFHAYYIYWISLSGISLAFPSMLDTLLHKFLLVNQALSLGIAILYDKVNTWNTNHARATIPTVDFWREAGLIVGLRPANERRRYKVTSFLIGWAQT